MYENFTEKLTEKLAQCYIFIYFCSVVKKLIEIMKTSQFVQELKASGCYLVRNGRGYDIWFSPITGGKFPVPRHGSKELGKGLECRLRHLLLGQ